MSADKLKASGLWCNADEEELATALLLIERYVMAGLYDRYISLNFWFIIHIFLSELSLLL